MIRSGRPGAKAPFLMGPNAAGVEVIVTTLAGDLMVLSGNLQTTSFQTWIDGAAGCYNSIVVADLDDQAGLLDPNGAISLSHAAPFLVGWGVGRQP